MCIWCYYTVSTQYYKVVFDGESGHIKSITNIVSGVSSDINQQFYWYNASTGNKVSKQVMDELNKIFYTNMV